MAPPIRKIIDTEKVAPAIGPYSHAVVIDRIVYVSGQVGVDRDGKLVDDGNVQTQTKQILKNLAEILDAAGSSIENIVKTTVFLANIQDFSSVNEIYQERFTKNLPARAAIQVAALPLGALIEIEAIAVLNPLIDQ